MSNEIDRPLLILDLDETLVSSSRKPREHYDFQVAEHYVVVRPDLEHFLGQVFQWYDVAVWTSSGESYATDLVPAIFPDPSQLEFCWAAPRCTRRFDFDRHQHYAVKDLKKVRRRGYALERVVMIDDSPEKLERNYGNHLRISSFEDDPDDRELVAVLPFLEWLKEQPDFRAIEKRNWRTRDVQ